jgi:hypothetical protein
MSADGRDAWSDRRRANEDEYFRKRDQELLDKARVQAEDEAALGRLAEAAAVHDKDILRGLQKLGYDAETVLLIHLMPLIEVAWTDGAVSDRERDAVTGIARARGVVPGSRADRQLATWLMSPPSRMLTDRTLHLLGVIMQRRPPEELAAARRELLASCNTVASASGGMLGFGTISTREQQTVDRIVYELERKGN